MKDHGVQRVRATLDDVAARAGVSKATASKVLNHRPNVGAERREAVEKAIRELDYSPSTGARSTRPLSEVTVIFDSLVNVYSMHVLDGVVAAARREGVHVAVEVVSDLRGVSIFTEQWLADQRARGSRGVIIVTSAVTSSAVAALRGAGLHVVAIDPIDPMDERLPSVGSTNFLGAYQATQHLIELGHERIAHVGGVSGSVVARERLQGYTSAMREAGLEVPADYVQSVGFGFDAGRDAGVELLAGDNRPTAIFAACDVSAMGVLEAARRGGFSVPEQLSLVGFDDTYSAVSTAPSLTTVRQPIVDMGRVALRTLIQLASGVTPDSHHVQLATHLVVRESTAPPLSRAE